MTATPSASLMTLHALAIAHAGEDFGWTHPEALAGWQSAYLRGLRVLLAKAQEGLCAACGETLDGAVEVCHLVASRNKGKGVEPGNVYIGHKSCNIYDRENIGDIVSPFDLIRPDLVQTVFPAKAECAAAGKNNDDVIRRNSARDAHRNR